MKKHISLFMIFTLSATLVACSSSSTPVPSISTYEKESSSSFKESTEQNETGSIISTESSDSQKEPAFESMEQSEAAESSTVESHLPRQETFLSEVLKVINSGISTDKESISNITLENRDLCISISISDPSPLTYEDLMFSRTSSVTDEVLTLENYFDLWDTITIDFGEHGYIQNSQDNIHDDGYGAYFSPIDFTIQQY